MTTLVPDLVTTNFDTLSLQRVDPSMDYRTIGQIEEERRVFNDASDRGMVDFNSKDKEDFPFRYVLTGILEHNTFSRAYFSVENVKWLHSHIRYQVYNKSIDKTVISKQKDAELLETMRRIFLQNSNNPNDIPGMKNEISRLNNLVLIDVIPRILSEIAQYKHYLRDIETVRTPIALPENVSVVGTKLYNRGPADVLGLFV